MCLQTANQLLTNNPASGVTRMLQTWAHVDAGAGGYVCVALLAGMHKMQHEVEMDTTFLATGCE